MRKEDKPISPILNDFARSFTKAPPPQQETLMKSSGESLIVKFSSQRICEGSESKKEISIKCQPNLNPKGAFSLERKSFCKN